MNQPQSEPSSKDNLPPEFRRLKRPKPSARVDAWGCGFFFGLLWTVASLMFFLMCLWMLYRDGFVYYLSPDGLSTMPAEMIFTAVFGGISGVSILIGLGLMYLGAGLQKNSQQLAERGVQTQGIIFDRWEDLNAEGSASHYVAIAFKTPSPRGGQRIYTRAEQNIVIYEKYQIGASLTVEYLPEHPSICRMKTN